MATNILIPMAGAGSRFTEAGYEKPKPFIDVNGTPMIEAVVNSLNINGRYIYVALADHWESYDLDSLLSGITPGCKYPLVGGLTDGAAVTALNARKFINNADPLIIANSDQIVEWDSSEFLSLLSQDGVDGVIATFESNDTKWSYAEVIDGVVTRVAEKEAISDVATVGIYAWKKGSDFVKYAARMIGKDIRTNDEFYICPVYNEAIQDGKTIVTYPVSKMHGIGTPEDLEVYLESTNV